MTKAVHVSDSPCLSLLAMLVVVSFVSAPVRAQSSARQIIEDAAAALGGRERIQAVKTLVVEGQGKEFSFGQGARWSEMGQEASVWKVLSYRRAYELAGARARFEQTRTPLYAFYAGHLPGRSVEAVDGDVAFNIGASGAATRVWNRMAVDGQRVEFHRHPLTLLRAALDPAAQLANPRVQGSERLVDITLPASTLTVTMAIDGATRLPARVVWMTDIPIMGDIAVETRFGDYVAVDRLQLPTRLTTRNEKYLAADIRIRKQSVNADVGDLAAPAAVRSATPPGPPRPIQVTANEASRGIWHLLNGTTHNGVLVEFSDYLAIVDAPDEARTLAMIAKARELRPNKPVTTLILTHHHSDHTGGVRAAVSEGVTRLVAHKSIRAFLQEILRRPHTIVPEALARKPQAKPVTIVEVDDQLVLKDSTMAVNLYYVHELAHAASMLMVYFPTGRLLTDADLYFPDDRRTITANEPDGHAAFTQNLLSNITFRKLQIDHMMPIHGRLVPYSVFLESALTMSSMTSDRSGTE
ncbi:MAG: MBL fold metallo-hydrolase [Acidobacteria bacterium]|nr:MBL fold metallo-hydrolase [Acidobacteriota bacterium]